MRLRRHVILPFPDGRHAVLFGRHGCYLTPPEFKLFDKYRRIGLMGLAQPRSVVADADEFQQFCNLVTRNGWACDDLNNDSEKVTAECATEVIEDALAMWKPMLRSHPVFGEIQNSASAATYYLLEKAWFVSCASEYLGAAAESATGELQSLFSDLEKSERDHHLPLTKSLGIEPELFELHDPEISTRLLIASLRDLARRSPLSLVVCLSLFEASEDQKDRVLASYSTLEKLTGLNLDAFKQHFVLDLNEQHQDSWKLAIREFQSLSAEDLSTILDELHTVKHAIENWYNGLLNGARKAQQSAFTSPASHLRRRAQFEQPFRPGESR